MRSEVSPKTTDAMFRYHLPGGGFTAQQYQTEYLSQVVTPYPEAAGATAQQQGVSTPAIWTGTTGVGLTPAPSVTNTTNSAAASAAHQEQTWAQFNHVPPQPHLAPPPGHFGAGPHTMAGYPAVHEGYVTHQPAGHHMPDTVTQALYTTQPHYKGQQFDGWVRTPTFRYNPQTGKTRTKDKYRVVYTDHQRQQLEEEFRCNRYITIRRKAEIAMHLGLSDRQVKIWFQNRRAKERKVQKKMQLAVTSEQEKNKAPSQPPEQTTEIKQENKVSIKHENGQQATPVKPQVTIDSGPRIQNVVTLGGGALLTGEDTKYLRNLPMKVEYPDTGMRMIAHGPGLEVTATPMAVAGYTGVMQYSTA